MLLRRRREIAGSASQFTYWLGDLADDQQSAMDRPNGNGILLKGTAMQIVVGPVLTRKGGYAFDCFCRDGIENADIRCNGSGCLDSFQGGIS
jgi:hypothetical protein